MSIVSDEWVDGFHIVSRRLEDPSPGVFAFEWSITYPNDNPPRPATGAGGDPPDDWLFELWVKEGRI